jgi:hypothetical protein
VLLSSKLKRRRKMDLKSLQKNKRKSWQSKEVQFLPRWFAQQTSPKMSPFTTLPKRELLKN